MLVLLMYFHCLQECATRAICNFFITTADASYGACYAKSGALPFTMGDGSEYPNSRGMARLDLVRLPTSVPRSREKGLSPSTV